MTHIEILRTYNNWRRDMVGEKTLEDFGITPRMIGEALDAVIKDAERIDILADYAVIEGFVGVDNDIYDLSCDVAERNGREEASKQDQREGFRLLIDAFKAKESRQ